MSRWARRTDKGHAEIVSALRRLGCAVIDLSRLGGGVPDLLICQRGVCTLAEVKRGDRTGGDSGLSAGQRKLMEDWPGPCVTLWSVDDSIAWATGCQTAADAGVGAAAGGAEMSPIRASERRRYPAEWRAISVRIRARSGGRCECEGECGLHRTTPGPRRCEERHGQPAQWARGCVVLTVAHLDHQPEHCTDDNLKAMCQRCHLRYDVAHHRRNAAATRREQKGNGELFERQEARRER